MPAAPNPDPTPDPNPRSAKPAAPLAGLVQAESMIQLALAVPAGCFVGLFLGYLLDKHFRTHWIVIAGMLLGSAGGFLQIFTTVSRMSKKGDK